MFENKHNQHSKQLKSNRATVMNTILRIIVVAVFLKPFTVIAIESPYGNSSCVEYDREGELYLVKNDCSGVGGGCTHQRIDLEQAIDYAREYQWIDVNASMKRPGHALWEAELKLLGIGAKGLVMIYLPQGIDEMNCGDIATAFNVMELVGIGTVWLIEAIRMRYGGHYPVDHTRFQDSFSQLIEGATEGNRKIMVTSKSYGASQALEVFHNNPDVFHVSIGPSFGIFDKSGDDKNPHIQTYIDNLARAQCKMCIITSFNDCWSLNAYGSALSWHNEELFQCNNYENPKHPSDYIAPVPDYCYESLSARWDCEERGLLPPPRGHQPVSHDCYGGASRCYVYGNIEVYDAIYDNQDNVKVTLVPGSGHYTPDYYSHGLIDAMRRCPSLFDMEGSVINDILNGNFPKPSIEMTLPEGIEVSDRQVIYLAEDELKSYDRDSLTGLLREGVPNSYLNLEGDNIPIEIEAYVHQHEYISEVDFYEDDRQHIVFSDGRGIDVDAARIGPDYNYDWGPLRYYPDLIGLWVDVKARVIGHGGWPYESDTKRVLVMRTWAGSDFGTIFPEPIPDIAQLNVSENIRSSDVRNINTSIYLPLPAEMDRVDIYVNSKQIDTNGRLITCDDNGCRYSSSAIWDVYSTWCDAYPRDILCNWCDAYPSYPGCEESDSEVSSKDPSKEPYVPLSHFTESSSLYATIRVIAYNAQDNYSEKVIHRTIRRSKDPFEAANDRLDHLTLTDVKMFDEGIDETLTGIKDPYRDTTISAATDSGLNTSISSKIDSSGEAIKNTTISETAGSELDESISSEIDDSVAISKKLYP